MRTNKKGFTIVELVIVIAVIAILAGVMIPTFSNVIEKADASARNQIAASAYKDAYASALADGKVNEEDTDIVADGIEFDFDTAGDATGVPGADADDKLDGFVVKVTDGVVAVETSAS